MVRRRGVEDKGMVCGSAGGAGGSVRWEDWRGVW